MNKFAYLALGLIILITVIFLSIIIFGEDRYRYQCQDPEMWSHPSCQSPICDTSGTCTHDVTKRVVQKVLEDEKN